jgi:hypothetical protein
LAKGLCEAPAAVLQRVAVPNVGSLPSTVSGVLNSRKTTVL